MKLLMVLSPRRYESGRAERSMLSLKNIIRKGISYSALHALRSHA